MAIADRHGLPVAAGIASASPHETKLVEITIEQRFTAARPERIIGDRAYDADQLDQRLKEQGITLIAPHRPNRRRKTQDHRPLRRYRRPWKDRAVIRMAAQLPPPHHAMGVSRNQLPRHGSTRLHANSIETSVR
jgi:Transposase DDE domain